MNGQTIATIRKFYGLNQAQLAELLNVSQPYIAQVEGGSKAVTQSFIYKITAALDLTPEKLQAIIAADTEYRRMQDAIK
ncbi:helix-turn-helix domain-containing protein [Paenisporosarcina sp. NPDC076898]|uniref:helix-turn-helix domain-containing protein n=1 Tax=unclassified Paenisporosarcina TaxID=2642018 RepID=UPI003D02ADDE